MELQEIGHGAASYTRVVAFDEARVHEENPTFEFCLNGRDHREILEEAPNRRFIAQVNSQVWQSNHVSTIEEES